MNSLCFLLSKVVIYEADYIKIYLVSGSFFFFFCFAFLVWFSLPTMFLKPGLVLSEAKILVDFRSMDYENLP